MGHRWDTGSVYGDVYGNIHSAYIAGVLHTRYPNFWKAKNDPPDCFYRLWTAWKLQAICVAHASYRDWKSQGANLLRRVETHAWPEIPLKFKNCNVLYIHYYQDKQGIANIYEFIFQCRPSSNNKNLFLLEKRQFLEVDPFDTLLTKGNIYIPISGDKLPCSNSVEMKRYIVAYLLQACHLLSLWKKCGLLESEKKLIRLSSTTMEIEQSKGNHVHVQGRSMDLQYFHIYHWTSHWLLPNWRGITKCTIEFSNDAEYRFKGCHLSLQCSQGFLH